MNFQEFDDLLSGVWKQSNMQEERYAILLRRLEKYSRADLVDFTVLYEDKMVSAINSKTICLAYYSSDEMLGEESYIDLLDSLCVLPDASLQGVFANFSKVVKLDFLFPPTQKQFRSAAILAFDQIHKTQNEFVLEDYLEENERLTPDAIKFGELQGLSIGRDEVSRKKIVPELVEYFGF